MKPICVPCGLFFRVKRNGFYFEEGMPGPGAVRRQTLDEAGEGQEAWEMAVPPDAELVARVKPGPLPDWTGYKLWVGDLWECRGCGAQIISGVAPSPLNEHYKPDYEAQRARLDITLRIDDC